MDINKRTELLAAYGDGPAKVKAFLGKAPRDAITFRPALDDAWTMAEHVHHLVDAELHGYVRYRLAVAEPGRTVIAWDQGAWKRRLEYETQELAASLELFTLIRSIVHRHLTRIVHEDWARYTFVHPDRGTLDLDGWLEIYAGHVKTHLEYLERNLRLFSERE